MTWPLISRMASLNRLMTSLIRLMSEEVINLVASLIRLRTSLIRLMSEVLTDVRHHLDNLSRVRAHQPPHQCRHQQRAQ